MEFLNMDHTESSFAASQCKNASEPKIREVKSTNSAAGTANKIFTNAKHENELKSSQISSSLDQFCRNDLNESSDFIDCDSKNKFKFVKSKIELFSCEICKEDITDLDIYGRGVHVNNCIDKQISSTTVSTTQPTENIFILECPLCFKNFVSPELRAQHIKKCGKSKGLGTQAILKALELQERHALERVALGLPSKPPKPVKSHKTTASKKAAIEPKNKAQSDIQLAKALSLSLTNTHEPHGESASEDISVSRALRAPIAQQNPGKKPSKQRKGLMGTPLLVLRSEEDRKKLLLDKVAAIIAPREEDSDATSSKKPVVAEETKKDPNEVPVLWHLSSQSSEKWDYYVEQLLDWIVPSNVEVGAKLGHLSQIAGHEIVTQLPVDYTFSSQNKSDNSVLLYGANEATSSLIGCLQSLVSSSWMSDVDIHTSCGTVLPAHKLLLAVRCPPLKKDLNFCSNSGKAILKWENTSFNAALQFLNFVYTGHIEPEETMISDLLDLAEKYEVHDLKAFLNAKGKTESPVVKPNFEFYQVTDDQPTSLRAKLLGSQQDSLYRSQDDSNMDLEIVYNCISSSLRPTQSASQKFLSSACMKSPECSSKSFTEDHYPNSPILVEDSNDVQISEDHDGMQMVLKSFSERNRTLPVTDYSNGTHIDEAHEVQRISKSISGENCTSSISVEDTNNLHIYENHGVQIVSKSFSESNCPLPIAKESSNSLHIDEGHEEQMISKPYSDENPTSPTSDDSQLIKDSPERNSSGAETPMLDKCISTSPIIFDISDSEDDIAHREHDQLVNSFSQKSDNKEPKGRLEELDVNSVESNSSEDSVKILKSSPVTLNAVQKEHDEFKIGKSLGFSQCLNEIRLAVSPQKMLYPATYGTEDSQKLSPDRWCSKKLYESSTIYSDTKFERFNLHESGKQQVNSPQSNNNKNIECSSEFDIGKLKVSHNSSPFKLNKRKLESKLEFENEFAMDIKLNSSYKDGMFQEKNSAFVKEHSDCDRLDDTLLFSSSQKSPLKKKLVKDMHASNSLAKISDIQVKKCLTGEELCSFGELQNSKLLLPSREQSSVKKRLVKNADASSYQTNNCGVYITNSSIDKELDDRLLLPASQKSSAVLSAEHDSKEHFSKGRNILPEFLFCDSDSAMSPPPNYEVNLTENEIPSSVSNTDSVEKIRKNVASPEVICFSSDSEASPLDESSSFQKESTSKEKARMNETPIMARNSSKGPKSNEVDSPKLLHMSYQSMDDFVFEEPYADFVPDISSPENNLVDHISSFSGAYSTRNLPAEDDTAQEPVEQWEPDASPRKTATTESQKVVNEAGNIMLHKIGERQATLTNTSSGAITPQFHITDSPITPLPNYKAMMTPDIKQALKRFGVKAMPRKKAVALLDHIYNETHPLLNGETEGSSAVTPPKKPAKMTSKCRKRKLLGESSKKPTKKTALKKVLDPKGILLSSDTDDSSSENSEANRLGCIPEISFSQCTQDSPTKSSDSIEEIKKYILSHEQLYSNILTYMPLNMVAFHQELKSNGIKITIPKLMSFLDEQCITFTCPRNEEKQKKRTARANQFRKNMIAKMSQQTS